MNEIMLPAVKIKKIIKFPAGRRSFAEKTIRVYNDEILWSKISKNNMDIGQEYSAEKNKLVLASFFLCYI